jgi:hypothetical protein
MPNICATRRRTRDSFGRKSQGIAFVDVLGASAGERYESRGKKSRAAQVYIHDGGSSLACPSAMGPQKARFGMTARSCGVMSGRSALRRFRPVQSAPELNLCVFVRPMGRCRPSCFPCGLPSCPDTKAAQQRGFPQAGSCALGFACGLGLTQLRGGQSVSRSKTPGRRASTARLAFAFARDWELSNDKQREKPCVG